MADDQIKRLFKDVHARGYTMTDVARESNVPRPTCYRLRDGNGDTFHRTRERLLAALKRLASDE